MAGSIEQQYRRFLFILSGFIFFGSAIELFFVEHYESTLQVIPFIFSGVGLIAVLAGLFLAQRATLKGIRVVMWIIAAGSLFGVYEHLVHNYEFVSEIKPNLSGFSVLWETLHGASPFLAPGILSLGALLAYAATWRHPDLNQ